MSELTEHLRALADFAYKHGFHELGYDPVANADNVMVQLLEACILADGFLKNKGYSEHDPLVRGALRAAIYAATEATLRPWPMRCAEGEHEFIEFCVACGVPNIGGGE